MFWAACLRCSADVVDVGGGSVMGVALSRFYLNLHQFFLDKFIRIIDIAMYVSF